MGVVSLMCLACKCSVSAKLVTLVMPDASYVCYLSKGKFVVDFMVINLSESFRQMPVK